MTDPRLILLSAYGGPYDGSFIPTVRALCAGAAERGWAAETVFWPEAEGRPWLERLRRETAFETSLAPPGGRRERTRWLGEKLAERPGPTILHTHFTLYDLPALFAGRRRGPTAVIWHVHTPLYPGPRARARNAVKYGVLGRRVDSILASGAAPAESLLRAGAPRRRLEIAGSGVQVGRFPPATEAARDAARASLGLAPEATVLLHFGWDWHLKNGDLFLGTVRSLADRGVGGELVALTVGGEATAAAAVERAGLGDRVRVLEPTDDVYGLYAASDLFVSSSRVEGEPFAVIESLLTGLPVVVTDIPGHRGVCGELGACRVAEASPEALAAAAAELLDRPAEPAAAERAAARDHVAARFDLGRWAQRMLERYEAALRRAGPSPAR